MTAPISSNDRRQQRRTYLLPGLLLDRGERENLPLLRWSIVETGTLVGEADRVFVGDAPEPGLAVVAWGKALDLPTMGSASPTRVEAMGTVQGVNVIIRTSETGSS